MNIFQMYQLLQQGNNPFSLMRQLANGDTEKLNFINNLEKQNPQQWEQIAKNLAQSKGANLNQIFNSIGIPFDNRMRQ